MNLEMYRAAIEGLTGQTLKEEDHPILDELVKGVWVMKRDMPYLVARQEVDGGKMGIEPANTLVETRLNELLRSRFLVEITLGQLRAQLTGGDENTMTPEVYQFICHAAYDECVTAAVGRGEENPNDPAFNLRVLRNSEPPNETRLYRSALPHGAWELADLVLAGYYVVEDLLKANFGQPEGALYPTSIRAAKGVLQPNPNWFGFDEGVQFNRAQYIEELLGLLRRSQLFERRDGLVYPIFRESPLTAEGHLTNGIRTFLVDMEYKKAAESFEAAISCFREEEPEKRIANLWAAHAYHQSYSNTQVETNLTQAGQNDPDANGVYNLMLQGIKHVIQRHGEVTRNEYRLIDSG